METELKSSTLKFEAANSSIEMAKEEAIRKKENDDVVS